MRFLKTQEDLVESISSKIISAYRLNPQFSNRFVGITEMRIAQFLVSQNFDPIKAKGVARRIVSDWREVQIIHKCNEPLFNFQFLSSKLNSYLEENL